MGKTTNMSWNFKPLLRDEVSLDEASGVYTTYGMPPGSYDNKAATYDAIMTAGLYNRMMWGNSPSNYSDFAEKSLNAKASGTLLDVGCGTLAFTAAVYNANTTREIILSDYSLGMMGYGKNRLDKDKKNIVWLRADGFNLPFKEESLDTVVCHGTLHVFEDRLAFCKEMYRVLKPDGDAHFTSLVTDRWLSEKYIKSLHQSGEMGTPKTAKEVIAIVQEAGFKTTANLIGGMVYIDCLKK